MNQKPVWKLSDVELVAEITRRGDDAKVLDALTKVQRMLKIGAERQPALKPGLDAACSLISTFAIQFGGELSEASTHALLREPAPNLPTGPKPRVAAPIVRVAPVAREKYAKKDGVNVSERIRQLIANTDGLFSIQYLQKAFPTANKALPYMITATLVKKGMLEKVGHTYRKVAA